MSGYYTSVGAGFQLYCSPGIPAWRTPQVGALGQILARWSLGALEPLVVSLPTGVGKTAVAMALPHMLRAARTLVVVPSQVLREQSYERFRSQTDLRQIGALEGPREGEAVGRNPTVHRLSSRTFAWDALREFDVVIALPNTISPSHYPEGRWPPVDLFDLIIIDEAHHAPAATWNAVLERFSSARAVLLTATPRRRDGQRLPGAMVYYYPLRKALDEKLYQPLRPCILDLGEGQRRGDRDIAIATEVSRLLREAEHATSQVLIRASSIPRAEALVGVYGALGLEAKVLHSRLGAPIRKRIMEELTARVTKLVVVVGMLGEGFDQPSFRILAYHDKHKSLQATAQLIGRLARVDASFPQTAVVVTVNDADVYPELKGALRELYREDRDWASVLPGIIDDEINEEIANTQYAREFTPAVEGLDLAAVHPLRRAIVFECVGGAGCIPGLQKGVLPVWLQRGETLGGQQIIYSGVSPEGNSLLAVTQFADRPRWHDGEALDSSRFDLHLISYRRAPRIDQPDLLLLNTGDRAIEKDILELLDSDSTLVRADPLRLQKAFDSLVRLSVSSVGVRNTYLGRGIPSYRMYAGSRIENGLRDADTSFASLGHAMIQVEAEGGAYTAGVSTGKAKVWETRYTPLRLYEEFLRDWSERYWFPTATAQGALLPQVSRGRRLFEWPDALPVAAELDYALIGAQWEIEGIGSLDRLELLVGTDPTGTHPDRDLQAIGSQLPLLAAFPRHDRMVVVWVGLLDASGAVESRTDDLQVRRGHGRGTVLSELLEDRPPTVYFMNGEAVRGQVIFERQTTPGMRLENLLQEASWDNVDITAETRQRARRNNIGISVHEALEDYLRRRPKRGRHRWILANDGAGEIADYLVLEVSRGSVHLGLWHAKYSGQATPGVRVTDMQEVVAQAMKSRRWIADRSLWSELRDRIAGTRAPRAYVVDGSARKLDVLLGTRSKGRGRLSFASRAPIVSGEIGIVQPGLSRAGLLRDLHSDSSQAGPLQIQQLLTIWHDCLSLTAGSAVVLCSR